ncbi:MAG: hypothetical protein R3D27_13025 [Hyphomicrobiaceae bacterium]
MAALTGITKNYTFAAETAFRLIKRVMDAGGDRTVEYLMMALHDHDPVDTATSPTPRSATSPSAIIVSPTSIAR